MGPAGEAMNKGYSLVELVVTIVVATILAALAIPYFTGFSIDASWFNDQAKAAVRYAQRQAVAQRRSVHVVFAGSQLKLCYVAACTAGSEVLDLSSGAAYVIQAPAGVTLSGANFFFNGLGQPIPTSGTSFVAGSGTVIVTAETGYVQ